MRYLEIFVKFLFICIVKFFFYGKIIMVSLNRSAIFFNWVDFWHAFWWGWRVEAEILLGVRVAIFFNCWVVQCNHNERKFWWSSLPIPFLTASWSDGGFFLCGSAAHYLLLFNRDHFALYISVEHFGICTLDYGSALTLRF